MTDYVTYEGVKLTPRMEEVLIYIYKNGRHCSSYGHLLHTINALERRGLTRFEMLPKYSPIHNPFKLTDWGRVITEAILNKS